MSEKKIVCGVCGEESGAKGSSMYGGVHKFGPRDHGFKPTDEPASEPRESKPGHTPGPWKARHVRDISLSSWLVQANGRTVADCSVFEDGAEQEANARLIAAAPRMLALLKDLEGLISQVLQIEESDPTCTDVDGFEVETVKQARALIAEVEG